MSKPQRRTCLGLYFRHSWEKVNGRQKCLRCEKVNNLGMTWRARFWDHVNKSGPTVDEKLGPCWLWTGHINKDGYGYYSVSVKSRRIKNCVASRLVLELVGRPCPRVLVPDHLCRNRACVNPLHLEHVTVLTNIRRGERHSKLKRPQVFAIRADVRPVLEIAAQYGVSRWTVVRIRNRRQWATV